jgi:hypothetical protein
MLPSPRTRTDIIGGWPPIRRGHGNERRAVSTGGPKPVEPRMLGEDLVCFCGIEGDRTLDDPYFFPVY